MFDEYGWREISDLIRMKKMRTCNLVLLTLLACGMMLSSCHKKLDYGIVWDEQAATTQMTKDSLKVELEWYGDDAFMTATVKDKSGQTLAIISRQSGDDICTVIKYLRNDTGAVRGFLVYPGCYPVAERRGDAKIKEGDSKELEEYKDALWDDFYKGNHPNDIGLALVMDEREDRPYAARYYFRYDWECGNNLRAIYDPITKQIIKSLDGCLGYELSTEKIGFERDSIIGDVHLMFKDIYDIDCCSYSFKTYCGYRPMEEFDFESHRMIMHRVYRSDRPEPYVTVEMDWDRDGRTYKLSRDYKDYTFATTYVDGVIKKVEEVSQWGTVLKRDVYVESEDNETYICHLWRYNYKSKQLEEAGQERIERFLLHMNSSESSEMILDSYLRDMWGRYANDNYWNSTRLLRDYDDDYDDEEDDYDDEEDEEDI